ncbi:transcriptional regulator GcvA [Propylenella binzhouense]|uniref:transcriptional regulator GcvA n=1 Tax=Propylenella binzhouense TaxID=2555902 RepID=UPI0019676EC8
MDDRVSSQSRRNLPSMKALQAFEAAARHLNFTRAAVELNLTQTAISHQIRNLEEMLGGKLFARKAGRLDLTPIGRNYVLSARLALSEISMATDRASYEQRADTLTIGCLGTFLVKTLLPKIGHFHRRHPDIALRFKTLVPIAPPARPDYDVAIHYGVGDWPGVTAHRLGDEEVFPVCSPRLLEGLPPLREPADLARHTLIRVGVPILPRDDWPFWLEKAGVPDLTFAREINFDLLNPAFHAAIEGLGVVLGRSAAVAHDIDEGRLVEPFNVRIVAPSAYYLLVPQGRETLDKVAAFRDWALEHLINLECRRMARPSPASASR